MKELIAAFDQVIKFGLQASLKIDDRDKHLEKNLVKVYSLYFDISYEFDNGDYGKFDRQIPDLRRNVESNFPEFGYYKTISDINDIDDLQKDHIGDAIDDLSDIIVDLCEIKWRIENNSLANGLWFFKLIFYSHTQQHILDLLNYMKQRNG